VQDCVEEAIDDEPLDYDEVIEITMTPFAAAVHEMLAAGWSHDQVVWALQELECAEARGRSTTMSTSTVSASKAKRPRRVRADIQADSPVDTTEDKRAKWRQQKANQRQKLNGSAGGRTDNVHY
jgi:hypothetical protein